MAATVGDLLDSIYAEWDMVTDPEKDVVTGIDDKLCSRGNISPADYMTLKKILKEIRHRKN